ncbi:hypothetical protein GEO37_00985 [Klebsiella pneumoniae]|nr:hypothetical protein [Klebsiella pneumoniae]
MYEKCTSGKRASFSSAEPDHKLRQERLIVRTRVDTALAAKARRRRRMAANTFQWRKPDKPCR